MEFLICVKQVPDDSVAVRLDPATGEPDLAAADPQAGAFDSYALEMATRYTEENGGEITAVSVGPEEVRSCLKDCLAVGASNAYRMPEREGIDPSSCARLLAEAVKEIEETSGKTFDLILCGRESTDSIDGCTGELLAAMLGYPCVTDIVEFREENGVLLAKKELESGYQIVECPLPAVVTVSRPDYDPRIPTIRNKLAARKKEIPALSGADIAAEPLVEYLGYEEAPKRDAGVLIKEEEPEDAVRRAMETLISDQVL